MVSRGYMARIGDVSRLLDESLQSYYWLGFILADGSFSENNKRVKIGLGEEDQDHLKIFVEYLNKKYTGKYCASFMDSEVVPDIVRKLGLRAGYPKTYNPPEILNYEVLSDDKFISLMAGFIDGDGYVGYQSQRSTVLIRIKLHSSWLSILEYMVRRIYKIFNENFTGEVKLNNAGYVEVSISNFKLIKKFKEFILQNNIYTMSRKWGKIDLKLDTKDERVLKQTMKINILLSYKIPLNEIAYILDLTLSQVKRVSAKYSGELK
jgi:hypothetical protein